MPDSAPTPEPLRGDPARQAPDLHRGIVFQLWRSVEAWIDLAENELLYLEGAEDFDIVDKNGGTIVQAKATAANITLRTEAVLKAMANFWLVCVNHPEKFIRFRYVTTAGIGYEAGNPFNDAASGIKLWQKSATEKDLGLALILQKFLASDSSIVTRLRDLAPSLLDFLNNATHQEVFNRLIAPMSWEVESVDEDVIRESIGIRLRAYGEGLGFRPSESMVAIDRLYRIAAETAKKGTNRILSRDDFRNEFEAATSRVVSMSEIAAMRAGAYSLQQAFAPAGAESMAAISGLSPVQRSVPALPDPSIDRPVVVGEVINDLLRLGVVVIKGSSGMGKSTVAKLAAKRLGGDWVWLDLQDVPAANVPYVIRGLASVFVEMPSLKNIGLDNLNFSIKDLAVVELSLPAMLRAARNRGGAVLITTQRDLPLRIMQKMALSELNVRSIPRLDEKEIAEFAQLLGCPSGDSLNILAKFVHLQTSGHPRLVHARLVGQSIASWPRPNAEDLITQQKEIVEEREVARQLLNDAPSGDKELLYRLSLAVGPFRKDHAILVGQAEPSLDFSADSFSRLAGPWIDVVGEGYYRLSPLLQNSAKENWNPDRIKSARKALAQAMLSSKEKTLIEASEILFQGILSDDIDSVTAVTIGLQSVPFDSMRIMAEQLGWLVMLGRTPGNKIFKENNCINFFLRLLQFRIIAEQAASGVDDLCILIDSEFDAFEKQGEIRDSMRVSWLMTAVIYAQANVDPTLLVGYWAELYELFPKIEIFEEITKSLEKNIPDLPDIGNKDFHTQCMMMVLAREMNSLGLLSFARAINSLPSAIKKVALVDLGNLLFPLRLAVDRAWVCEIQKEGGDSRGVLANFETLSEEVSAWGIPDLLIFIARARAAIEDEYCNDGSKAISILANAKNLDGGQMQFVDDQRAMVLFRSGKFAEAVSIWKDVLPSWPCCRGSHDHSPLYACERAGVAAAKIADWNAAILFFRHGQRFGELFDEPLFVLSYFADEAFAIWKSGETGLGLDHFVEALTRLEQVSVSQKNEVQVHRIRKCFEQIVRWCRIEVGYKDEGETWEPPAGFCSSLATSDKISDIPASPYELQWHFLAEIEIKTRGAGAIFDRAVMRARASRFACVRIVSGTLQLSVAFSRREFSNLVGMAHELSQAFADGKAQLATGKTVIQPDAYIPKPVENSLELIEGVVISALIVLASEGISLDSNLSDWRMAADSLPGQPGVSFFFSKLDSLLRMPMSEIIAVNQTASEPRSARCASAVLMSFDLRAPLAGMIVGQALLLDFVSQDLLRAEVEQALASLIRSQWLCRVRFPAAFLTPGLTIPAIRSACGESAQGLKLAARILLEARLAVRLNWPLNVLENWRKLAAD